MENLFVYGTLAPGKPNHHVMQDIPGQWQPATLKGHLHDAGWGAEFVCPGMVPSEDGEPVAGFVLTSDQLTHHWARLDEYEGDGYQRTTVEVTTDTGEPIEAQVYALKLPA